MENYKQCLLNCPLKITEIVQIGPRAAEVRLLPVRPAIAITKTECIIVGARSFRNEYDGDTLNSVLTQVLEIRGSAPKKAFCDRGFRGRKKHKWYDYNPAGSSFAKNYRKLQMQGTAKFGRRSAIEPVIGHLKNDFRLARNYLKGIISRAQSEMQ